MSFTTNEGASLPEITYGPSGARPSSPVGVKEAVNVYVRDMSLAPEEGGAFALASAANGPGEPVQPLIYRVPEPAREATEYGSAATGRSAISADGNEVAFVTTAESDLVDPSTPPLQVAVRYMDTHETKLVSRCFASCKPGIEPAVGSVEGERAYGAAYSGGLAAFQPPPAYGEYGTSPPAGASISADGSTVAWMGEDIGQQAQLLAGEARSAHYTEPLWRRIAPGSETPTERVTGGSDPANPDCAASGETILPPTPSASDPCQGPFVLEEQAKAAGIVNETGAAGTSGDFVPRLSADGYVVAFTSNAPLVTFGEDFGRGRAGQPSDLYIANMRTGLTRLQALTPLTELAGGENAGPAATAPIFDFEISPGGDQVAFATRRTRFPLTSPGYVSPPSGEAGMNELFDVDLANDTLTRVTHGYADTGEVSEHAHMPRAPGEDPYLHPGDGALSPSFSADGQELAFSSTASNLAYDDGNAPPAGPSGPAGSLDGGDAFVVRRRAFATLYTPQSISAPPQVVTEPAWNLGATAVSRSDGSVRLYVSVPGAGRLRVLAQADVRARAPSSARRSARGKRGHHRGRPSARGARPATAVAKRLIARAARSVTAAEEPVALVLRLASPYRALALKPGGLSATLSISFSAIGRPSLHQSLVVSFARVAHASRHHAHGARRRDSHSKGHGS